MITIIKEPAIYRNSIEYQEPDGIDLFRHVPLLKRLIPANQNSKQKITGRIEFEDMIIKSDEPLELGKKFDYDNYLGILPNCYRGEGMYECSIDMIEYKEKEK